MLSKLHKSARPSLSTVSTHSIAQASAWLRAGKLLAYPTESVWGIGCDAFDESAVKQLLTIKQRPIDKGMIVVTDSVERIMLLLEVLSDGQRQNVLKSWSDMTDCEVQQAHTWLLPLDRSLTVSIPTWITGVHNSVAVRVIAHPMIKALCAQMVSQTNPYGFIVSTSCNPAGHPPATTFEEAYGYFDEHIGYLQGETLGYTLPSQIHDATTGLIIR